VRIAIDAQKLSFARSYQSGGISRYSYHLLAELRLLAVGHSIEAFAPRADDDPGLASTGSFRIVETGAWTERPIGRIIWEQAYFAMRAAGRFDLVHGLAFALPIAWRGKALVTILDLSFLRFPHLFNRGNRIYLGVAARLAARQARRVLTISEHGRQEIVRLLGVRPDRVTTTYCGVDRRFQPLPAAEVEAFRRHRQLPARFVLYLGTLEPRKNVPTLLRAYARVRSLMPDSPPLVLAGARGWLYEDTIQTIDRLSLRESVLLPGFVPDEEQPRWYNAATVFAYPSLYEGFGLPPLEAMASGTPVVTSNASSLPEVVGSAGLLVNPLDDEALALAIVRLLEDAGERERLRAAGLEQARRFSWPRMAQTTLGCYEEVARES
jgi:glycosyltransferase involved in cell wall biosynthesis